MWVDLSTKRVLDLDKSQGGFVLELRLGCYKGVIAIDGSSLYESFVVDLATFVNKCIFYACGPA